MRPLKIRPIERFFNSIKIHHTVDKTDLLSSTCLIFKTELFLQFFFVITKPSMPAIQEQTASKLKEKTSLRSFKRKKKNRTHLVPSISIKNSIFERKSAVIVGHE